MSLNLPQAQVQIGDGEPFDVTDLQFVLDVPGHPIPVATLHLPIEGSLEFKATPEFHWWFARTALAVERRSRPIDAGSDPWARKIAKAYRLPLRAFLPVPPSALNGEYRRRQRARAKRRRR